MLRSTLQGSLPKWLLRVIVFNHFCLLGFQIEHAVALETIPSQILDDSTSVCFRRVFTREDALGRSHVCSGFRTIINEYKMKSSDCVDVEPKGSIGCHWTPRDFPLDKAPHSILNNHTESNAPNPARIIIGHI